MKIAFFTQENSKMAYFKAVTIHYKTILIFVTTVLKSNEETEKNCIFGTAMPGHQESLKLRPRTVFRYLSPFKIGINIYLEQQFELICHEIKLKNVQLQFVLDQTTQEKISGQNLYFSQRFFNFSAEIVFFGLTWRVTLL